MSSFVVGDLSPETKIKIEKILTETIKKGVNELKQGNVEHGKSFN